MWPFITGIVVTAAVLAAAVMWAPRGWRTVVFNTLWALVVAVPPLIDQLAGIDWTGLLGEKYGPAAAATFALGNVVLRFATSTPIGRKD